MKSCASCDSREGLDPEVRREGEGLNEETDGARRERTGSGELECSDQSCRVALLGPGLEQDFSTDHIK